MEKFVTRAARLNKAYDIELIERELECGEDAGTDFGRLPVAGQGEYSDISRWEKGGGSRQENGICAARQLPGDGRQAFVR